MTMKKRIRTAGALTLAAITVLSAAGLSSVYGALGVDTEQKCSLTFTLDGTEFAELNEVEIPVDVYQIADITEEAQYTAHTGYEGLGLDQISSTTTAEAWDADGRRCHEDRGRYQSGTDSCDNGGKESRRKHSDRKN